jgi:2-polyprenyl-6-methoxyphenol hydroxylase-like FAD-dependent oxidoreductase
MMEQHKDNVDVAICGAGPVGLALAALLARRGIEGGRIALIDARALGQAISDPRSIALAWGSRQLLEEIQAWHFPATPIHTIHVSRRGQLGRSLLDRSEHKLEALGYVARYGDVVDALARAVDSAGVQVLRPARVAALDETADHVSLSLDDGRTVTAQVVVGAEGGVFGQQEDKTQTRDYGQSAVIARVSASSPIAHRAFERFTDEGHGRRTFFTRTGRSLRRPPGALYQSVATLFLPARPERRGPRHHAHGRHRQCGADPAPGGRPGPEPRPARRRRAGTPAGALPGAGRHRALSG